MYSENEVVVYRKDMYRIKEIKRDNTGSVSCYLLVPYENDDGSLRVQVPATNKKGYLRKVSTKDEIESLISRISEIPVLDGTSRVIENEVRKILKKPSLDDLVCIIKTTYLRNQERLESNKKTNAAENAFFKETEKLLYQEMGVVLNLTCEQVKEYIIQKIKPDSRFN
ncbi:MAG: hypothetical protein IJC38_08495 [Erysipelotrichaceae bacterium]|nr:hypothetical protein [Erysipelotrichaceae bacterium]